MSEDALEAISMASVLVSPISAWEIGLLAKKSAMLNPVFQPSPEEWFRLALAAPSVSSAPFDADIALSSCVLPDPFHRDPADRFLVATARRLLVPIVTRDKLILAYAALDHVDAIACRPAIRQARICYPAATPGRVTAA